MSSKKRFRWTNELEMVLLDIWEDKVLDLRRQKRNSHVYREMAAELKTLAGDQTERLQGNDIKTKINNLSQRYRSEKKTIGPLGGKRPDWKCYDRIDKILGSLPCIGSSLVHESYQMADVITPFDDGSSSEMDIIKTEIIQEDQQTEESIQSPCTPDAFFSSPSTPSSTCGNVTPRSDKQSRLLKRKAQEDIMSEFLQEIRRSNDLTEQELKQNQTMREAQLNCITALQESAMAILDCIKKTANKN